MGFIFGGRTGLTQEDLARERQRQEPEPMPQNFSEGISAVARALNRRWADEWYKQQQQSPFPAAPGVGRVFDAAPVMNAFRPRGGGLY